MLRLVAAQAERAERLAEMRAMRKQEREFNRKKEYARRCRVQVIYMARTTSCCAASQADATKPLRPVPAFLALLCNDFLLPF